MRVKGAACCAPTQEREVVVAVSDRLMRRRNVLRPTQMRATLWGAKMRDPKSGAGSGATQNPADGPRGLGFDLGQAETAIIPIIVGDMGKLMPMSKEVHEAGLFINQIGRASCRERV